MFMFGRFHRQSVEMARKRLLEYQTMLKGKHPSVSATSLIPNSIMSVPPRKSEGLTIIPDNRHQDQRPKSSPNKYQPVQPFQMPTLEQDCFQLPRQNSFPQKPIETTEIDVLAKQCMGPQEQPKQFSQSETQQRECASVPSESHILSRALSDDRPLIPQHSSEITETSRAITFQTLDFQRMSQNNENTSAKLTEPSSFLPLVAEHSFSSLPAKVESGKIQECFPTMSKSAVSISHSIFSQMQDKSLPSSDVTAQQGHLKALQEQLDRQKEVLRSRQEAQEQLLLCKQKELEGQTGVSVFLPLVPLDSFASLPSAEAESGRIWESSPAKKDTEVSSGHPGVPQLQDRLLSFSQPVLSQQNNFKFLQQQLNIQQVSLQARQEAQEVLCVNRQAELDGRVWSEQTKPPSHRSQVTQHAFPPLLSAGTQSGKIQEQFSSKSEEDHSEIPTPQDGSSSFLQQFLPLRDSLKLLREQLTAQRDALQARHEARVRFLLPRRRDLGDSKSGHMRSSFPPMVAHRSVALHTSAETEHRFRNFYLSEESTVPSSHSIIPTFQDEFLGLPQRILPQQEDLTTLQEQSHVQRVILGAQQETQKFVHKQSELEKGISEQTDTSLFLSQIGDSERWQECMSIRSDSAASLKHSKIPRFQERFLRFSQDNLVEHQECLDKEKEALHCSQIIQGNTNSEQTGSSSFIPQLGQLSFTSLPSESGTTQEPLSTESDSSHFQIPQLQDRLLKISQLIQPQQDNLKALQERLATQREIIVQSRKEAQEELLLYKQSEWKEGLSPEQIGTSSFLPLNVQHSFASVPLSEHDRFQEPCPTESDNTASTSQSEMPGLPDRHLGLQQPVLPQPGILPRLNAFEEKSSSENFIQLHHGDLKVLQQQLDIQRKAIRVRQEVQEKLLLQRLTKLEKKVAPEPTSSSSAISQVALPVADSERIQKYFPTESNNTVPSSHPEVARSQDGLLSLSQPVLPQQDRLTAQLHFQREMVHSNEKNQEELLSNKKSKVVENESSERANPFLGLPKESEHLFIPLPFAEVKSKDICELDPFKNEHRVPSSDSVIPKSQDRLLSFSQLILAQQDNLGFQKQLDLQKEVLRYSQKAQEELLVQRQTALQQQIQKHQETLKDLFKDSQVCLKLEYLNSDKLNVCFNLKPK